MDVAEWLSTDEGLEWSTQHHVFKGGLFTIKDDPEDDFDYGTAWKYETGRCLTAYPGLAELSWLEPLEEPETRPNP